MGYYIVLCLFNMNCFPRNSKLLWHGITYSMTLNIDYFRNVNKSGCQNWIYSTSVSQGYYNNFNISYFELTKEDNTL